MRLSTRWRTLSLICFPALAALWSTQAVVAADRAEQGDTNPPLFARADGTPALENERVTVRRFIIQPGQSTGPEVHGAHQLLVFVKGGVLTSNTTGRSSVWPDGRVVWFDEAAHDQGGTNTGHGPIELLWIVLKPSAAPAGVSASTKPAWGYLNYPDVPGEDVLENNWVIVQRFKMKPGEWEGVHAHNPNTFYIFIKGGKWVSKSRTHPAGVPGSAADGTIAWMDTIDLSEEHQSGNTGSNETEVVWVALKR
jgi:quercetin dioxygenase-like cupin family protein